MTYIWPGLSTQHLQAYPSRSQMLFSQRKDNVPKRCFHDNNLGQESSIALLSALCWETRPTVLNRSFSRFKQAKFYVHMLAHFSSPPRDTKKLSLHQRDWELLNLYLQASASTKRLGGPCCLVLLSLWAGCTILMVTQAMKLIKTEVQLLRCAWPWGNSELNMWFSPFYRNSWQTWCLDTLKHTLGMDLYSCENVESVYWYYNETSLANIMQILLQILLDIITHQYTNSQGVQFVPETQTKHDMDKKSKMIISHYHMCEWPIQSIKLWT